MSRLLPSHTIPSLPPVEPEFVWSCIHRQPSIYLKSFKTYNQKYITKETLPMGSRKCHEFLSQTSSRSLLNNSSLTGPYVRSCLWVSSKKRAGSTKIEGTLTGSWPSWRISPAYNGLMFAWFFWLWSEWKKDQDGSQPILSDLGAMFFLTLLNQKQINPSFMASQTKTFVEDPSNLTPFAKKTQPPNPIFCGSHPQHFVFTKPSYAARLPPLQYSKNKCSFSGPQIFSLISTGFWTWVKNSKPKHRKNMNWKHMI